MASCGEDSNQAPTTREEYVNSGREKGGAETEKIPPRGTRKGLQLIRRMRFRKGPSAMRRKAKRC